MVHQTVPRNELDGIVLAAEVALLTQRSLGERHLSTELYTDSRIALCWVLNSSKRLRMWAFNRVQAIVNMIRWMRNGKEEIPLFHIRGLDNLADILTKVRPIELRDLRIDSAWNSGLNWMTLPSAELPREQFVTLTDDSVEPYNKEVFQEVEAQLFESSVEARAMLSVDMRPKDQSPSLASCASNLPEVLRDQKLWLLSRINFLSLGWERAMGRVELVLKAIDVLKHRVHERKQESSVSCQYCNPSAPSRKARANLIVDRAVSRQAEAWNTEKSMSLQFQKKEGIWLSWSRLEKEGLTETRDLDCSPFFDHQSVKKILPVVLVGSEVFHSFLVFTHLVDLPHRGVEATLRRIRERFHPIGNPRRAIARLRNGCAKCRIMLKQVVALELADFPSWRTTVTPPFYAVQIDIAMHFRLTGSKAPRQSAECNALVIVCILTSATSILAMEGLSTQAVVQALERHSYRYGVPSHIYVDSGTQLAKLEDAKFRLRDVSSSLSGRLKFAVTVATPKAHHQQGRVEAKIKVMHRLLTTWSETTEESNTVLGWETIFARVASTVDDIPIARGSASAASDLGWEIITPNRLKLGRNNHRQLDGPIKVDNCPRNMLQRNQLIASRWYELFVERIGLLVPPPKQEHDRQPQVGDVVLFVHQDPNYKKLWTWRLGLIEGKISRSSYRIRYSLTKECGECVIRTVDRAVAQISIIVPVDELHIQHPDFLSL